MMTNLGNGSEEWKTKVLSMLQGDGLNITDNPYRVTLDKRTRWADQGSRIRYTMRSGGDPPRAGRAVLSSWIRARPTLWHFEWRGDRPPLRRGPRWPNGRLMEDLP